MPVIAIDSLFYGHLTVTPWNIVKYNVFPDAWRGPNLYGTEPWYFCLLNLALNFNVILPLALVSLPALGVTHVFDYKRLGAPGAKDQGGAYATLACRLAPVYVWLGLLSMQAHKEERFMYPIYPLICFNAAVTLYLMRGWLEKAYITLTTPYQVSSSTRVYAIRILILARTRPLAHRCSGTRRSRCSCTPGSSRSRASPRSGTTTTPRSTRSATSARTSSRGC